MYNPATFTHLLLLSTPTAATGAGWSLAYDCFMFSANLQSSSPHTNGFLIRLQLSELLNPLYIPHSSSFLINSSFHVLHFPPFHSYFSSYSSVHQFVLSILSLLGIPTSDPDPLARLIFSFTSHHHLSSLTTVVPLFVTFTCSTFLRNRSEAADWVHGGTPQSKVVRTLRPTFQSLRSLKEDCCLLSLEENETCMVCLEGFDDMERERVSRLPCSHLFHFGCVSKWFMVDHRCPVCRSPMPWVQAIFPELSISSSTTLASYDDDADDFMDASDFQSESQATALAPQFFSRLGFFLKNIVKDMFGHV